MRLTLKTPAQEMLVSELIERYRPLYPDGENWEATVAYLYAEEEEHMAQLFASLAATGWRDPVIISEADEEDACVRDGTHRVSAALRHGVVSLPVTPWSNVEETSPIHTELIVKLIGEPLAEGEYELIFEQLRSFELTPQVWVTSDICSGAYSRWELLYYLSEADLHRRLKQVVRERLQRIFPERSFTISARLVDMDAEDDRPTEEL